MAEISFAQEKQIIEFVKPPEVSAGYVLDFSNDDFQLFIGSNTDIDITSGDYDDIGTSKLKRLRSFLKKASNSDVKKVLEELSEHQKSLDPMFHSPTVTPEDILKIANSLTVGSSEDLANIPGVIRFEEIQSNIINELKDAEFLIWVAVSWFTDPILFDTLLTKKRGGLNIQIIINDDETNNSCGLDFDEFECYKLSPSGPRAMNIMHHKFCVIDLSKSIHGSYNWTKSARFNGETADFSSNRNEAQEFARQFMRLKFQGV